MGEIMQDIVELVNQNCLDKINVEDFEEIFHEKVYSLFNDDIK